MELFENLRHEGEPQVNRVNDQRSGDATCEAFGEAASRCLAA
jgi:hypothetical protein